MSDTQFEDFRNDLEHYRVVPVIREVFNDLETPVGIYRRVAHGRPGSFLLESAAGGIWSDYSFIGVNVFGVLWADGKTSHWNAVSLNAERAFAGQDPQTLEPFAALSALYSAWKSPKNPDHPPLTGGLVGFMGWES
ncbi:MAG: anthranilate synthase component I, partial [Microbacteriaceae bacterium]